MRLWLVCVVACGQPVHPRTTDVQQRDEDVTHRSAGVRTVVEISDAFSNGNARLLAAHYTFDARIEAADGDTFAVTVGRDALERDHAAFFARHGGVESRILRIFDGTSTVAYEWFAFVEGSQLRRRGGLRSRLDREWRARTTR